MGFLLLEDPILSSKDVPHAGVAIWQRDKDWHRIRVDYNGISGTVVPGKAGVNRRVIIVGDTGKYTEMSGGKAIEGVIKEDDALASVNFVNGSVIAVGILGGVYRMRDSTSWEELTDKNIEENLSSVCAFPSGGFVVCGWEGVIALYKSGAVKRIQSGTNVILTSIICDEKGEVFACGQKGTIICGSIDALNPVGQEGINDDFWSIAKFKGEIYVASTTALYKLVDDEKLEIVEIYGVVIPTTFYHLDTYEDSLMLSVGPKDAVLFDGKKWTRIL